MGLKDRPYGTKGPAPFRGDPLWDQPPLGPAPFGTSPGGGATRVWEEPQGCGEEPTLLRAGSEICVEMVAAMSCLHHSTWEPAGLREEQGGSYCPRGISDNTC